MIGKNIRFAVSRQILEEVIRTIKKKLPQALPPLREFLTNSPIEVIHDPAPDEATKWTDLLDECDAYIFASVVSIEPAFFATGDNHFLRNPQLKEKSRIAICSPREFLEKLGAGSEFLEQLGAEKI